MSRMRIHVNQSRIFRVDKRQELRASAMHLLALLLLFKLYIQLEAQQITKNNQQSVTEGSIPDIKQQDVASPTTNQSFNSLPFNQTSELKPENRPLQITNQVLHLNHKEPEVVPGQQALQKQSNFSSNEYHTNLMGLFTAGAAEITTPTSLVDEEELNKLYLQNSMAGNLAEESATTSPSIIELSGPDVEPETKEDLGSQLSHMIKPKMTFDGQPNTNADVPHEILQMSETKFVPVRKLSSQEGSVRRSLSHLVSTTKQPLIDSVDHSKVYSFMVRKERDMPIEKSKSLSSSQPVAISILPVKEKARLRLPERRQNTNNNLADLIHLINHINSLSNESATQRKVKPLIAPSVTSQTDSSRYHQILPIHDLKSLASSPPFKRVQLPVDKNMLSEASELVSKLDMDSKAQDTNNSNYRSSNPSSSVDDEGQSSKQSKPSLELGTNDNSVNDKSRLRQQEKSTIKHALVSPYSAYFDSGLTVQNFPLSQATLNKVQAELAQQYRIHEKLKFLHDNRLQQTESSRRNLRVVAQASEDPPVKRATSSTKTYSPKTTSIDSAKDKVDGQKAVPEISESGGAKRADKSNSNKMKQVRFNRDKPSHIDDHETKNRNTHSSVDDTGILRGNDKVKVEDSMLNVRFPPRAFFVKPPPSFNPNKQNPIDEAFKKDLYYYSDSNKKPTSAYGFPRPLTVGELANHQLLQHGVPFRLKSPTGESYQSLNISDDFRLPSETNQYDEYVYLPDSTNKVNEGQVQDVPVTGIKFDEELKEKLAMKTVEAITKDPDLANEIFGNSYDPGIQAEAAFNIQPPSLHNRLYPDLFGSMATGGVGLVDQPVPSSSAQQFSTTLPTSDQSSYNYFSNFMNQESNGFSNPISAAQTQISPQKWAINKMPDLIPIPLAATVPGYLIRLPNGQILAAALTNSVSIQGIQNDQFVSGYKKFINERLKGLINKSPSVQSRPSSLGLGNLDTSGSAPRPVSMAPQHVTSSLSSTEKAGQLARQVLSQLGFGRSTPKPGTGHEVLRLQKGGTNKRIKSNQAQLNQQMSNLNDQDLLHMPLASLNEPVFSFADEAHDYQTAPSHVSMGVAAADLPDMFQNEDSLALRDRLTQFLGIKNLFGSGIFKRTKKRKSLNAGVNLYLLVLADKLKRKNPMLVV